MGYLRIKCHYCGGIWEVYRRDIRYGKARECPHCSHAIDAQTRNKQIIHAYCAMYDANLEL